MIKRIALLFFCVCLHLTSCFLIAENMKYINGQKVISVDDLLKIRPDIQYTQLSDAVELYREKSPLSQDKDRIWWEQHPIIHPKNFILSIPHGRVHARKSFIIVDDMYVDELIWPLIKYNNYLPPSSFLKSQKTMNIHSKVAVITQGDINNYYHWMVEILPRLALLQKSGMYYDYLYLPVKKSFVKETIELLGIVDSSKILAPLHNDCYIQADELIVPSALSAFGYSSQFVIDFLRQGFIPLAQSSVGFAQFAKRIFISRRGCCRRIMNEDELFALFQEHGFVRYNLEELSILEQVALFHNAEFIVGEHGAGLTNIIFAQPGTQVLEIFQARERMMFWYLGQELGLQYTCVKTIDFDTKKIGHFKSIIPLDPIKYVIAQLFN